MEFDKFILKSIFKSKGLRIGKIILKMTNKVEGFTLLGRKTH